MNKMSSRIHTLDYLRGFALLGIILVNVVGINFINAEIAKTHIEGIYASFLLIFIESKFFSIFSILFGVGFYIFMDRATYKAQNKYALYFRRLIVLFIFGVLHSFLQPGEALKFYAIAGVLLLIFLHLKKEINLILGLLLLVVAILLDAKLLETMPYFILGLAIGQYGLIYQFNTNLRKWIIAWSVFLVLTILSVSLLMMYYAPPNYILAENMGLHGEQFVQKKMFFDHLVTMTSPFISCFYMLTIIIVVQNDIGAKLLAPLKYYGRMALTNYIFQTLFIIVFVKVFFNGSVSMLNALLMCLIIYSIQIMFSVIWLKYFKYGPLEYLWRMATYLKVLPFKSV